MKRVYVHTVVLELVLLSCQVVVFKLAADYWGALGFSEYALTRRTISLFQPVLLLGVGVALPRYAARAAEGGQRTAAAYLHAGLVLMGVGLVAWLGFLLSWDRRTAQLIFGDETYAFLMPPVALTLLGLSAHVIAYGYLRGRLRLAMANWLQLINIGLVPVAILLVPGLSVAAFFIYLGLTWLSVGGTALLTLLIASGKPQPVARQVRELVSYGVFRVPGEFLQVALLGLPAILVAHVDGVEAAGQVAFAMSLVNMLGSIFSPIGVVLLPTVSRLAGLGEYRTLTTHVQGIAWAVFGLALVAGLVVEAGTGVGVRVYLGPEFLAAVPIVRIAVLATLPYALFMTLRSVLDALHESALNTRNLGWAMVGFLSGLLASAWLDGGANGVLAAATIAFYILGTLTVRDTVRSLLPSHG